MLRPVRLSYWIIDDGSKQNKGLHLNVYAFDDASVERLLYTLRVKYSLVCSIHYHNNKPRIYIFEESIDKVRNITLKHFCPSIYYKLSILYFDLLPFYAILRAIPNKLLGVLAIFISLLILLFIPIVDISRVRGSQSRPLIQIAFYALVVDFFILMFVGSQHVESPYTEIGAFATAFYFGWFLIIVPVIGLIENTIMNNTSKNLGDF